MGSILVTGATGYIGGRLVDHLASKGVTVFATGRRPEARLGASVRYFQLPETPSAEDWRPALKGLEVVIHCAARAHVLRETQTDSLAAFRRVNTAMTLGLARAAWRAGVRRFVYVSSIGVCGAETFGTPFDHNSPAHPHSPYTTAKHEAEIGLRQLSLETGLEIVIVRPPLVYGPDAVGNFGRLVELVDKGLPLPLAGLQNRRSLIGLDNLVDFLRVCAIHPRAGEIVHAICDGPAMSTTDLVRAIAAALNRPIRLMPLPAAALRRVLEMAGKSGVAQQLFGSLEIDSRASRADLSWIPPSSVGAEMDRVARARRFPKIT